MYCEHVFLDINFSYLVMCFSTILSRVNTVLVLVAGGARCSSAVRVFAHGAMGRWIDPSWGGPIELFLFPASAPLLV